MVYLIRKMIQINSTTGRKHGRTPPRKLDGSGFTERIVSILNLGEVSLQGDMNMQTDEEALAWGREACSSEFTSFKLSQVLDATNNFSEDNKLGKGGFGPVYKVTATCPIIHRLVEIWKS